MKRLLLILVAVCLCAAAAAQPACRTVKGIPYREANGDPLVDSLCRVDISCPADGSRQPVILWFHGGSLTGGKRTLPKALCGKGFVVVSADYRLLPDVRVENCIEDAAAAAAWVIGHIAEYGGDPSRIFVAGHSAGGYLTSMICLDKRWLAPYGIDPDRAFAAMIPYSGQAITHFARRQEMGLSKKQPLVDDLAPLYHVRPDCPPVLIISGDRELEMLGRYEENAYFWRMFRIAGHPDATIHELGGFNHSGMKAPGHILALQYMRERLKQLAAAKSE